MAINFAGGTDGISYGAGFSWPQVGCFSFRMKTTQTTANATPASIWNSSSRWGFGFTMNGVANKIRAMGVGVDASAIAFQLYSTTDINDGSWHTLGFNYNTNSGGANSFYVDGVSEASDNSAVTWTIGSGSPPLLLGSQPSFWPSYVGDLAEVAVWNRQLDVAEHAVIGKDLSPSKVAGNVLKFHAPLVRPARDRYGATMTGPTGTTVTQHGRVVYPAF
ncbi:LamG-like jellyroll fold domain-containing protein [Mesorhizobium sp. LjNodule214]|uniref:LamG-like jellyroll fold domain-containing protein n=1 Tax=Mesorhizobium sp. LjNodule214 TaxID=3342252 RepID=UPI003ECFDC28